MPNAKLINLQQAAEVLGVSLSHIRYLIRKGTLTATESKERMVRITDVKKAKQRPKRGNPNLTRYGSLKPKRKES